MNEKRGNLESSVRAPDQPCHIFNWHESVNLLYNIWVGFLLFSTERVLNTTPPPSVVPCPSDFVFIVWHVFIHALFFPMKLRSTPGCILRLICFVFPVPGLISELSAYSWAESSQTGFSGSPVVKNLPCYARDPNWISGPGRSHMPQGNWAHAPQLLNPNSRARELQLLSPYTTTAEAWAPKEPMLHSRRSRGNAKPSHCNQRTASAHCN